MAAISGELLPVISIEPTISDLRGFLRKSKKNHKMTNNQKVDYSQGHKLMEKIGRNCLYKELFKTVLIIKTKAEIREIKN